MSAAEWIAEDDRFTRYVELDHQCGSAKIEHQYHRDTFDARVVVSGSPWPELNAPFPDEAMARAALREQDEESSL